jgi:hypothetical protein
VTLAVALGGGEWRRFSLPHPFCVVGEEQYLLGAGSIWLAADLRLEVEVREAQEGLSVHFGGSGIDEFEESLLEEASARWERVVAGQAVPQIPALQRAAVHLYFEKRVEVCPPELLAASPVVAAALTVAALTGSDRIGAMTEPQVAELACRALQEVRAPEEDPRRFRGPTLMSLYGGAACVGAGEERLNVQQLLPPESFLLVLQPGLGGSAKGAHYDQEVRSALEAALAAGKEEFARGDEGFSRVFEMAGDALNEHQMTMLYGLLRVRQMTDAYLEFLGEPVVDNDRLAEICDEESAILEDYFDFPAEALEVVRSAAVRAGALGSKLTWAFGGYPAALILAPGRRREVQQVLSRDFPETHFVCVDMDPAGLRWGGPGPAEDEW